MKPNRSRAACVLIALATATAWVATASANPIDAQNPYATFIEKPLTDPLTNNGPNCASTAMMNSFVYLNNMFPNRYADTKLTRGTSASLAGARDQLCGFLGDTKSQALWEGKLKWFDTYAPNTSTFEGMTVFDTTGWNGRQFLTQGAPTIAFMLGQIRKGEDVEIRIVGKDAQGAAFGHMLTLTSVHIDDDNNNGVWDPMLGEMASIDYIDPNCVRGTNNNNPAPSVVKVTLGNDGLHFGWRDGNGLICDPNGAAIDVAIDNAFAESPIPEPATIGLLGAGLIALLGVARLPAWWRGTGTRPEAGR